MSWRNNEGLKECNKERGEAKRRKASHELEPYLQLKVALHWLSTLISPKPLQGGRGLGKSTRPEHHQETWIGAPGGGKGGIVAARAFSCTLYVSKVKWMRQEELFFFPLSLCVCALCAVCEDRSWERGKTLPSERPHTSFLSLSDKTLPLLHLLPEIAFFVMTLFFL